MTTIIPIPAFRDNYIWLVQQGRTRRSSIPATPRRCSPISTRTALALSAIIATHHHADHVGGIDGARATATTCPCSGRRARSIPGRTRGAAPKATASTFRASVSRSKCSTSRATRQGTSRASRPTALRRWCSAATRCSRPDAAACSRARPTQMWSSLSKLAALPPATRVYCGHEYTLANLRFAAAVEPGNAAIRARDRARDATSASADLPTLPSTIARRARDQSVPARRTAPAVMASAAAHAGPSDHRRRRRVRDAARVEERLPMSGALRARRLTLGAMRPTIAGILRGSAQLRIREPALRYRRSLILPVVLALAACATPAPPPPAAPPASGAAAGHRLSPAAAPRSFWSIRSRAPRPISSRCRLRRRPVGSHRQRLCDSRHRRPAGRQMGAVVRGAPRLRRAHGRAQPPLPLSHRHRGRGARHAARNRAAADRRERVQSERDVDEPCVGHLAVHARDRQDVRSGAELVVRLAARRRRRRRARRSTTCRSCTRSSTTGSSRSPRTTGARATCGVPSPATARRDCRPTSSSLRKVPDETRNYVPKLQAIKNIIADPQKFGLAMADVPECAVLHGRANDGADGRQARRRARRIAGRRIPRAQSAAQPPGDLRRRRIRDPAADRQGGDLRRQARPDRPAARFMAGAPDEARRNAAAGGDPLRHVDRDAALGQRHRPARRRCRPATRCSCRRSVRAPRARSRCRTRCSPRCRRAARSSTRCVAATRSASIAARYGVTTQDMRRWNRLSHDRVSAGQKLRVTSDASPVKSARARGRHRHVATGKGSKSSPRRDRRRGRQVRRRRRRGARKTSAASAGARASASTRVGAAQAKRATPWRRPFLSVACFATEADRRSYFFFAALFFAVFRLAAFFAGRPLFFAALRLAALRFFGLPASSSPCAWSPSSWRPCASWAARFLVAFFLAALRFFGGLLRGLAGRRLLRSGLAFLRFLLRRRGGAVGVIIDIMSAIIVVSPV